MNRTTVLLGGLVVVAGLGACAYPVAATGQESLGLPLEAGLLTLGAGLGVVLIGGVSPDPRISTVGGFFGNRDEDRVQRWLREHTHSRAALYKASPFESVHCEYCNTLMPAKSLNCPRCARNRRCRTCRKPLFFLAGAVRCGPCVKDEFFCGCPRVRMKRHGRWVALR